MRIAKLGLLFLWIWALHNACPSTAVSLSGWNSGDDRDVPIHVMLVSVSDESIKFRGSSD